jgi:phage portal protein BeeE
LDYQEAQRAFWRQTVLSLFNRTTKALSAWLSPAWGANLELRGDLDQIEALTIEREALWARLQGVSFLTDDEKRAAIGYGPLPRPALEAPAPDPFADAAATTEDRFAEKYWVDQPRVPELG